MSLLGNIGQDGCASKRSVTRNGFPPGDQSGVLPQGWPRSQVTARGMRSNLGKASKPSCSPFSVKTFPPYLLALAIKSNFCLSLPALRCHCHSFTSPVDISILFELLLQQLEVLVTVLFVCHITFASSTQDSFQTTIRTPNQPR